MVESASKSTHKHVFLNPQGPEIYILQQWNLEIQAEEWPVNINNG